MNETSFQIIADLLVARTGQQLTESRRWRIGTALGGVFKEYGIENAEQLVCLLADTKDPLLERKIVEALLNNETYFFRDKPTFDQLPQDILPLLAERRKTGRRMRIWSAGCSTGQEAHSIAMDMDRQRAQWAGWSVDILGTDISQHALTIASRGLFSQFDVQRGLSVLQTLQHFTEESDGWQLSDDIRKTSRFIQHNILDRPPSREKFDLILCRNVLLYFDTQTRSHVFERLFSALAPDGFLMLGAGESIAGLTDKFVPSAGRPSIFEVAPEHGNFSKADAGLAHSHTAD
ncbi:MAG: protein-glutamate O-methyltransferase CheR [Marinomonas sp.]